MADDVNFANALLIALQRQRDEALNKLAHAEANNTLLTAENAKLREAVKEPSHED